MPLSADTHEDLEYFQHFFEAGGLHVDETDHNGVRTQLHNAAHNNCLRIAEFLLRRNADASLVAEKGYTALHIAAKRGHDYMVGLILKYSRRNRVRKFIDAKTTRRGYTALHLAAKKNNYESVRLLLSYGANFEAKDNCGKMPIQVTTLEKVRKLLGSTGEMSRAAIEAKKYSLDDMTLRLTILPQYEYLATSLARNHQGYTPLQVAIDSKHLPTVMRIGDVRLQRLKSDSPLPGSVKELGKSVWFSWHLIGEHLAKLMVDGLSKNEALRHGTYLLFSAWKVVNHFDKYRATLKDPYEEPHIKFLEEVLEVFGFDDQHFDYTRIFDEEPAEKKFVTKAQGTMYYKMLSSDKAAERKSFVELVKYAICTLVVSLIKSINSTNLLAAVKEGVMETAKECTETSILVDMDIQDDDERRPLHIAAEMGNYEMVEFLLTNKADMLKATEEDNETPLHVAVEKGHFNIVELFLRKCDVDKVNDYVNAKIKSTGTTALHLAVKNNRLDIAWILLEYHAIYCIRDQRGISPSGISSSVEMKKLFKFIDEIFDDARNGREKVIEKLKNLERDFLLAVGNACNIKGYSPPQVATLNKHRTIATQIFKMVVEAKKEKDAEFVKSRA